MAENDELAERNRQYFQSEAILAVHVMASPGVGKTSLITRTIASLGKTARIGVIEGDIAGRIDTEKVLEAGPAR